MLQKSVKLINLFDLVNDAIIIIDKNHNVIFNNEKGQIFVKSDGKTLLLENETIIKLVNTLQPDAEVIGEHISLKIKKRIHHYTLNTMAINDDNSFLIAFVITDTTRLHKMHQHQQQLISQIRKNYLDRFESLKQLADSIAHEVRNPLVSIGGYANLLIRKCDEGIDLNEAKKYLQYIVDNAERLNYLTQQIEEMGDLKRVNLAAYSITKFMQEQESTFIAAASQFNKKLQLNIESEKNYTMYIDYDKLRFAITQIIEFVAEHTKAEDIVLHCYGTSYELIIHLQCTTDIIADEDLPYLFDPFYTTRSNVETFNLCIAQRIIMLHGGIITSSLTHKTMHFKISLPQDKRLTQDNGK